MGDYAGAVAAIKQRMADNWTTTPVGYQNEPDPQTMDGNGVPAPWVYFEVIGNTSDLRGMGRPGDHVWLYAGMIAAHVFVPMNTGTDLAQQLAVAIGEIFRAAAFYRDDATGSIVRTWSPRTDGGESGAEDGNWFRVTCRIPFEYLHRG